MLYNTYLSVRIFLCLFVCVIVGLSVSLSLLVNCFATKDQLFLSYFLNFPGTMYLCLEWRVLLYTYTVYKWIIYNIFNIL